ncbi:MAG TPA: alpha/beta fold hydrolase [Anaerolineales bacterium]|nr:alpha/beta fold hydrolase [Anaerolineales bacterium]
MTEPELLVHKGWTFRFRPARKKPGRLLVLIHGWTGDENSMWVLAHNLSADFAVLAPRAPYIESKGGYTWREIQPGSWGLAPITEMRPAVEKLLAFLDDWAPTVGLGTSQLDLMGFSQGTVVAYTLAILYPQRVHKLAGLSGFLPEGAERALAARQLAGKSFFVAHGRQDDMVPVESARRSVNILEASGVKVEYCESDGGHKVSRDCLQGMEKYFGRN